MVGSALSAASGGRSSRAGSSWPRPAISTFTPADPRWSDDFSTGPLSSQGLFIHEMTHVWQTQKRGRFYLPLMRHPFCRYAYQLREDWTFDRYGLEQQAEIVRHAFMARNGARLAAVPPDGLLPFA